ncbi:lysophospholipid acyltransferase family protein [Phaeacidiphilus oryzae]|uniref:lysophospholipid acyltransferase family protein n=1 Tax=Phaeacidiphilus oryzae TaxID=348818 RepID=UPI00190F82A7|nr:lysophospholipid acyltransferase family protein [Phaeacidiphilus oryzae]
MAKPDRRHPVFYWLLKRILIGPPVRLLYRPRVSGRENVPSVGPVILAPNHLSFCDSIFVPLLSPRKAHFMAKDEYFTGKGVKGRLMRAFFSGVGAVPVDRSGGRAAQAAIDTGLGVLRRGEVFSLYPEGTRSPDGRLYRGRTGVARLALLSGAPVIPVGVIGTTEVQAADEMRWHLGARPEIRFGEPLDFSRYEGMENDRYVLRAITDEVVAAILALSGQEYVDMYATKAKALAASGGEPRELRDAA